MIFNYSLTSKPIRYYFSREENSIFMKNMVKNSIEAILEVECIENINKEKEFSVKIIDYKQSNDKGFYRWAGDLSVLKNQIKFSLNSDHQFGKVHNMKQVQHKFAEIKPGLLVKHSMSREGPSMINGISQMLGNTNRFSKMLKYSHPYLVLFPGIYGKDLDKSEFQKGYRELPNFIHIQKVPIITEEKLGKSCEKFQEVEVNGSIDEENFEQDKLTSLIRVLRNRPRVPSLLKLNYTEKYKINKDNHWPEQAMCMSLATVTGSLYRFESTFLKKA